MFDWNDLRHFLAVAREGSTLAAAKALGVNQSTVHRHLAELEKQLGRQIVERHPTGYRLTELGEELRPYAESVEEAIAAFTRRLAACGEELTGTIRLTCATTVAHRLTRAALLDRFHVRYPGLRIELVMSDRILNLAKGEADVAIRAGAPANQALFGRKIAEVPWAVYAGRFYLAQHGRPDRLEDMNRHVVIGFAGEVADHQAARWLRSNAPQAAISAHGNDIPSILLAVNRVQALRHYPYRSRAMSKTSFACSGRSSNCSRRSICSRTPT